MRRRRRGQTSWPAGGYSLKEMDRRAGRRPGRRGDGQADELTGRRWQPEGDGQTDGQTSWPAAGYSLMVKFLGLIRNAKTMTMNMRYNEQKTRAVTSMQEHHPASHPTTTTTMTLGYLARRTAHLASPPLRTRTTARDSPSPASSAAAAPTVAPPAGRRARTPRARARWRARRRWGRARRRGWTAAWRGSCGWRHWRACAPWWWCTRRRRRPSSGRWPLPAPRSDCSAHTSCPPPTIRGHGGQVTDMEIGSRRGWRGHGQGDRVMDNVTGSSMRWQGHWQGDGVTGRVTGLWTRWRGHGQSDGATDRVTERVTSHRQGDNVTPLPGHGGQVTDRATGSWKG